MTIDPISLSELKDKRAAMTSGDLSSRGVMILTDGRAIAITNSSRSATAVGFTIGATDDSSDDEFAIGIANAAGLVATHNAADALLEVTEAALAWKSALDERKNFGDRAYRADPFSITTPAHRAGVAELDKQIGDRVVALQLALAKVQL